MLSTYKHQEGFVTPFQRYYTTISFRILFSYRQSLHEKPLNQESYNEHY